MIKAKVTDREVREGYYTISLSYCGAQDILNFQSAKFYNYGVYGWRYDVYELDYNLAICTGYSPIRSIPEKMNRAAVEVITKYNDKARKTESRNYKTYTNYRRAIERLYKKMVAELKAIVNYSTVSGTENTSERSNRRV